MVVQDKENIRTKLSVLYLRSLQKKKNSLAVSKGWLKQSVDIDGKAHELFLLEK